MSEKMTHEMFNKALPRGVRRNIPDTVIDGINKLVTHPELRDTYRDNLLSYTNVMADGKFKIESYVDAVRYVSFKLMGATNIEAYCKTFPDRYQRLLDENAPDLVIHGAVAAYNRTILVNKILEQTLIPSHILNADLHQEAINTLAELMRGARSEKVRSDSAAKLVDALKLPETQKVELDVNIKEDSAISDLRNSTLELVAMQKKMIEAGGMTVKEVAHSPLLIENGEVVEN